MWMGTHFVYKNASIQYICPVCLFFTSTWRSNCAPNCGSKSLAIYALYATDGNTVCVCVCVCPRTLSSMLPLQRITHKVKEKQTTTKRRHIIIQPLFALFRSNLLPSKARTFFFTSASCLQRGLCTAVGSSAPPHRITIIVIVAFY